MLNTSTVLKHMVIQASLTLILIAAVGQVEAGEKTLDFSLPDLKGKTHKLSDYRGKWVVVNFWATWCPPCLDEIPELVEFHEAHHKKDAVVLGIDFEQPDIEYLKEFIEQTFITYPVLLTQRGEKLPFGNLLGLPTTVLVSPEGVAVVKRTGAVTRVELEQAIKDYSQERK